MKIFLAGSTGVVGKHLIPVLVENKHDVVALIRSPQKARVVEELGARPVVADVLNKDELTKVIQTTRPEIVIHQLTALTGAGSFKNFDKKFSLTNRFRTEVLDTMLEAALKSGARRFIAQSFCGWPYERKGAFVKTEMDPLDPRPPKSFSQSLAAIRHLEAAVTNAANMEGIVLRYGFFYGPGSGIAKDGVIVEMVRKRKLPVAGGGNGYWSFIHLKDVANATAAAMTNGSPGIYNIVDDEPAPVKTWLPFLAEALHAKAPRKLPAWLAKIFIGDAGVKIMTINRGASNEKAKKELAWQLIYPSWRQGFSEGL